MHREALRQLLAQGLCPKILVFGELFLRHEVLGLVRQIAPEAPVPVLEVVSEEIQLGGAGEVAASLTALGAWGLPVALLGQTEEARFVRRLLDSQDISTAGLITDAEYQTRVVMRFLGRAASANFAQLLRADWQGYSAQARPATSLAAVRKVWSFLEERATILLLPGHQQLLLPEHLRQLVNETLTRGGHVVAAIPKNSDWSLYSGSHCVFVECAAFGASAGQPSAHPQVDLSTAAKLAQQNGIQALVIWDYPQGAVCVTPEKDGAQSAADPSGTIITDDCLPEVLALSAFVYALGGEWRLAWELYQLTRAIKSRQHELLPPGTRWQITRRDLESILRDAQSPCHGKVLSLSELSQYLAQGLLQGKRVVFAGGNFEVLQPGQVSALEWAKSLGDCLIVGVRSDRCLRDARGRAGGLVCQAERAAMVAALDCVDLVVLAEDLGFSDVLNLLRPQVVVKGIEAAWDATIGWQVVELYGGRIMTAPILACRPVIRLGRNYVEKSPKAPATEMPPENEPTILPFPAAA